MQQINGECSLAKTRIKRNKQWPHMDNADAKS